MKCPKCQGEGKYSKVEGTDWVDCEMCLGEGILKNVNKLVFGTLGTGCSFYFINETK